MHSSTVSPPPLFHVHLPHLSSPADPLPLCFFFRKQQAFKKYLSAMIKQDVIRQGKSPHAEAQQDNPKGGKASQEQAKESEEQPLPLFSALQISKLTPIAYMQRNLCRLIQASGLVFQSLSPGWSCLVDTVGHVLLMSFILSGSCNLSSASQPGSLSSEWRDPMQICN